MLPAPAESPLPPRHRVSALNLVRGSLVSLSMSYSQEIMKSTGGGGVENAGGQQLTDHTNLTLQAVLQGSVTAVFHAEKSSSETSSVSPRDTAQKQQRQDSNSGLLRTEFLLIPEKPLHPDSPVPTLCCPARQKQLFGDFQT